MARRNPHEGGGGGDYFGNARGATGEVGGQCPEIVELVPDGVGEMDFAGWGGGCEGRLQLTEQTGTAGDSDDHATKFSQ